LCKRLAKQIEDKFYEQVVRENSLGTVGNSVTWDGAVRLWEVEKAYKRSLARDRVIAAYYRGMVGGSFAVAELDENGVAGLRRATIEDRPNPSTANRYLAWLQAFLRYLHGERLVAFRAVVPKLKLAPRDYDLKAPGLVDSVLAALPEAQRAIASFALATGQRRGNVLPLRWEHVDFASRRFLILGSTHKSGKAKQVPLGARAVDILEQQRGKHPEWVFPVGRLTRGGVRTVGPAKSLKTAWRTACKKAGVTGLRFHDLRHQWASAHVQNGTPLKVLAELGGWASTQMPDRVYGHLSPNHLAAFADNDRPKESTA
jgi:integrase